jgi:hypothetical protein
MLRAHRLGKIAAASPARNHRTIAAITVNSQAGRRSARAELVILS